jgi:chorismate synthase
LCLPVFELPSFFFYVTNPESYKLQGETMLRFLTAGESHGPALTAVIEGIPAGLKLTAEAINHDLARRQVGYGRGLRMEIEKDQVDILSGVRFAKTLGTPISLLIHNLDWPNWLQKMSATANRQSSAIAVTEPRPGHADLPGALKYDQKDIRNILERASARETATRVAIGAVCRCFLAAFNIRIGSYVTEIGGIRIPCSSLDLKNRIDRAENSVLRCCSPVTEKKIKKHIDTCKQKGDSLGGVFEVVATGLPVGLGSYSQWDTRLDGRLAQAIMSIQAIKGVEIGLGFESARIFGSHVHDEIFHDKKSGFYRKTNNAGGIEGGISNGEPLIIRAAMKPIATLYSPLRSVDIITKKPVKAAVERSDICRVPSAAVIGEAMVAMELSKIMLEKFGADSMRELTKNYKAYTSYTSKF